MTIEQLLNAPADQLEKITNTELESYFAPYLNVTRPERVIQERSSTTARPSSSKKPDPTKTAQYQKARALAEQFGLKI